MCKCASWAMSRSSTRAPATRRRAASSATAAIPTYGRAGTASGWPYPRTSRGEPLSRTAGEGGERSEPGEGVAAEKPSPTARLSERSPSPAVRERVSVHEAVELGGVVADDLLAGGLGEVAELLLDVFLRIRPDPVGMREVRAPHDVVDPELVEQLYPDRVALIGGVALAVPVFARAHLEVELLELVLPLGVHAVEDVGDPAGAGLADDDLQMRPVFEDAGKDDRHQDVGHVHLEAGNAGRARRQERLAGQLREVPPRPADRVEMQRQAARRGGIPDRVPPRVPQRGHVVFTGDFQSAHGAARRDTLDLMDSGVDVVVRDAGQPGKAVGMPAAEFGEPVIVAAQHLAGGLVVIEPAGGAEDAV